MSGAYPIPAKLNVALTATQALVALGLLWVASHAPSQQVLWLAVIGFAFWMQMAFSILHEAEHNKLHPVRAVNDALGTLMAMLFPGSYQLLKVAHLNHHRVNRSNAELVDYIRPGESRVSKTVQFYLLICGFIWLMVVLMSVIITVVPWSLFRGSSRGDEPSTSGARLYLGFIRDVGVMRVRIETLLTIAFWGAAFWLLDLEWSAVLVCYVAFAFSWSSQQYIYHVRSPRHLVEGAFNLKLWRPLELLYLNFNHHLSHHRAVSVPWIHMRRWTLEHGDAPTQGYLATYLQLWRPPEPVERAWPVDFQAKGPLGPPPGALVGAGDQRLT